MSEVRPGVHFVNLASHRSESGELVIAEARVQVPFTIVRMFTIKARKGSVRGQHAHLLCSQFMICVQGAVEIICDDGSNVRQNFMLNRDDLALMVPPKIWNTVYFRQDDSILSVLCDRPYEEQDYVREYEEFLKLRAART